MSWKGLAPYLVPLIVAVLVLSRAYRTRAPRRIRPGRLWIGPLYVACLMAIVLWTAPAPGPLGSLLMGVGALAGGAAGYARARYQELSLDPGTGALMSRSTPVASLLFVGLFLARYALNFWVRGGAAPDPVQARSAQLMLYTDAMLMFAFAMVTVSAWEIWRRTRPLLAGAGPASGAPESRAP